MIEQNGIIECVADMERKTKNKLIIISIIFSMICGLIYVYDFFFMVHPEGLGGSDVLTQIGYMNVWYDTGSLPDMCQVYPLFYSILRVMYHFVRNWVVVILSFTFIWSFATNMAQIGLIRYFTSDPDSMFPVVSGSLLSFIWPISLKYSFFGGKTFWDMPLEQVFLTSGATAPDHSLTYLCVKPFALLTVLFFTRILENEEEKSNIKNYLIFALMLLGSVLAKPNFYQCFAPAGVIAVLIYLKRNGFKVFARCCLIAAAYLPATIWVIYGMRFKLNPYEINFLEGISIFGDKTPVVIVLARAVVFCLFVAVCLIIYRRRDDLFGLGGLIYLFGTAEYLLFIEPAEPWTLSMSWGYYIGMYVLFVTAIVAFYKLFKGNDKGKARILYISGCVIYAVHACLGIAVFVITWWPWWRSFLGL